MSVTDIRRSSVGPAIIAALSLLALVQDLSGVQFIRLPLLYPMRHTVAIGLLCVSLALSTVERRQKTPSQFWAIVVILIAVSALAAQAFRWMQIMDENPTHPLATVANFIHTALPNSVCLLGTGGALYALAQSRAPVYLIAAGAFVGRVVSTFGLCALLNELIQIIPASPAFEGEIAVDATTGFAIAGLVLWRVTRSRLAEMGETSTLSRSVGVAVVGTIVAFLVWRILLHERTVVISDQTTTTAAAVGRAVHNGSETALRERIARATSSIDGSNYQVFFVRDGKVLYSFPDPPRRHEKTTVTETPLPEFGGTLLVHPGSQFVRRGTSWASHMVLALGLTSSLLLALSVYLVQIARDRVAQVENEIVERRKVEHELSQQAKLLAASNADLEEFARAISHDLQEPLRSVNGFAQLLARRYLGRLDQDADEFLAYITDSAQRMSNMISGLLSYSRTIYGRETTEYVNLQDALEWAESNLVMAIEESKAKIHRDCLPTVRGNQLQLAQVFQNLLGNAIKYRRPDVSPVIEIRVLHNSSEHRVAVSDNGTGIPEHLHTQVFGLFKRGHGREYSGAGVGLALCKRIIEKHGGRIWVESTPGVGSTFHFTLPGGSIE